jgi:hypothetical protein
MDLAAAVVVMDMIQMICQVVKADQEFVSLDMNLNLLICQHLVPQEQKLLVVPSCGMALM